MRKYPLLVALILLALVVTACATGVPATPTPEPEPTSVPVPATPAAQEAAVASPDYFGTFTVSLPAADSPGRIVTADLAEDGSVQVTSDYQNGQPPIVETGTWQANAGRRRRGFFPLTPPASPPPRPGRIHRPTPTRRTLTSWSRPPPAS